MNQKEIDLIAQSLHNARPSRGEASPHYEGWKSSVHSVRDGLISKGHLVGGTKTQRFVSVAEHGRVFGGATT